jgi:O-acetyl-ADP-ribose deacetylase (regulator of RNase III)
MALLHASGNLLDMAVARQFDIIVHGCNCHCTMGSGIAKQLRERWPQVYDADLQTVPGDRNKLGSYTVAPIAEGIGFTVVNAYTQYNYNKAGETNDVFEYAAFGQVLLQLAIKTERGPIKFGFPEIGMGLAHGDRDKIIELLEMFAELVEDNGSTVTLVKYA